MVRILVGLFLLLISACTTTDKKSFIPGYSGNFGEVVLVMDDQLRHSKVGQKALNILEQVQYGLPQGEPIFTVIQTNKSNFLKIFNTHRNVVILKIDELQTGASFELFKSKWAKEQVAIEISAANQQLLYDELERKGKQLVNILNNSELNRIIDRNKKFGPKELQDKIAQDLNLKINLQKDAEIAHLGEKSCWIRIERMQNKGGYEHQISQGILISSSEYTDLKQFLDDTLLLKMNALTKQYLPGPTEGSFITSENRFDPLLCKEMNLKNKFAKECRGLWRMENNFMGGPSLFLSVFDEANNRIVYLYGYVYAPEFKKREYLREVEGMLKSIVLD